MATSINKNVLSCFKIVSLSFEYKLFRIESLKHTRHICFDDILVGFAIFMQFSDFFFNKNQSNFYFFDISNVKKIVFT